MHILEGLEELVHDVLLVHFLQDVSTDDGMKIRVHELKDKVDVSIIVSLEYVPQLHNVLVVVQLLRPCPCAPARTCQHVYAPRG